MQITISVRPLPGLKKSEREDIKFYTRFIKCSFKDLVQLLYKDYMYSPFNYIGREQGLHNICSKAKFVVIDVDHTVVDIHNRLLQLANEELECILGTTSDPNNMLRYRVLMPLNRPVTHKEYRRLIAGIRVNKLIPDLDTASQKPSQKFYSYADSTVLFNKGSPLIVDDYILEETETIKKNSLSCSLELHKILEKFSSYSTALPGNRTRYLLSAAFNLVELGADDKLLEQVILHLNNSFIVPKDTNSVYRRVINFIKDRRRFL